MKANAAATVATVIAKAIAVSYSVAVAIVHTFRTRSGPPPLHIFDDSGRSAPQV